MTTLVRRGAIASALTASAPAFDPRTYGSPHTVLWAEDPDWNEPAPDGEVIAWRNGGSDPNTIVKVTATGPAWRSSVAALNNRPAVQFNGTSHALASGSNFSPAIATPYTFIFVVAPETATGGSVAAIGTSSDQRGVTIGTSNVVARFNHGTGITGAHAGVGIGQLIICKGNGASSLTIANGTQIASGGAGTGTILKFGIGADPTGVIRFHKGHIALWWFKPEITSSTIDADMLAWAQSHYGTP